MRIVAFGAGTICIRGVHPLLAIPGDIVAFPTEIDELPSQEHLVVGTVGSVAGRAAAIFRHRPVDGIFRKISHVRVTLEAQVGLGSPQLHAIAEPVVLMTDLAVAPRERLVIGRSP
jgi:hypothetical protein